MTPKWITRCEFMERGAEVRVSATALDLKKALDLLNPVAEQCTWRLLEIEGVGDLSPIGWTMRTLESKVASEAKGLTVSWQWLVQLATLLRDLQTLRLVGEGIAARSSGIELELFDSSYWTFKSNPGLIANIERWLAGR